MAVAVSSQSVSAACPVGGVRIDSGLDNNDNAVLFWVQYHGYRMTIPAHRFALGSRW